MCVTQYPAHNGPIYPEIVGSSWKVHLFSQATLTKPSPAGKFFLQAKIRGCMKAGPTKREVKDASTGGSDTCCANNNKAFNQLVGIDSGEDPCYTCPSNSLPRMHGFYCESCGPGYQQDEAASFGCQPCGMNQFKSTTGPGVCMRCPEGATTVAVGQDKCVKVV